MIALINILKYERNYYTYNDNIYDLVNCRYYNIYL